MTIDIRQSISKKYCPRFSEIAVEMGFATAEQVKEALVCQVTENLAGKRHRYLGTILFDCDVMTAAQIDQVLNRLLKEARAMAATD